MDVTPVLAGIASRLVTHPDTLVEQELVTFDVLVGAGGPGSREAGASLLRAAADSASDAWRRERLKKAAAAVAAGEPCAFTPEGLSAQQAAAAQTVTQEEWDRRVAVSPLPPPPGAPADPEEEEEYEEDTRDEPAFLAGPPPELPQLPVRQFFPGVVFRVAQKFVDDRGHTRNPGEVFTLIASLPEREGVLLMLRTGSMRLTAEDVIANAGNLWFQPVPSARCLEDLIEAIDAALDALEDDDAVAVLRDYAGSCTGYLASEGPAPSWPNNRAATRVLQRQPRLGAWFRVLSAAMSLTPHD